MLQKFPGNNFEWIKDTSHYNEDFIEKMILMFKIMKNNDLPFLPERMKIKKVKSL